MPYFLNIIDDDDNLLDISHSFLIYVVFVINFSNKNFLNC